MVVSLLRRRCARNGLLLAGLTCLAAVFAAIRPSVDSAKEAFAEPAQAGATAVRGKAETAEPLRVRIPSELSPLVLDPYAERIAGQPKELRAVLGTHRGRHFGAVACLSYRPDGKVLASGGEDGVVRLWQANPLAEIGILTGHKASVCTLAFSPDGKLMASFGRDRTIRLWDLSGKQPRERAILAVQEESDPEGSLAFSDDGKILWGAAGSSLEVRGWTIGPDSVKEFARLTHSNVTSSGMSFSPNGTRFAAQANEGDRKLVLFDTTGGRFTLLSCWGEHKDIPWRTRFSPNGKMLLSLPVGNGGEPFSKLWDVTQTPPRLVAELSNTVQTYVLEGKTCTSYSPDSSYAISPDNRLLAKGGQAKRVGDSYYGPDVELWDLKMSPPQRISILAGHETDSITAVVFSPDGKSLASGSRDGVIQLWDLRGKTPAPFPAFPGSSFRAKWLAVSPVGEAVAVGGSDGTVRVFEHDRGLYYERSMIKGAKAASFSPDGATLAVAGPSTLRLWNFREGRLSERTGSLPGVPLPVRVSFAPDGRTLAVGDAGGAVRLWSLTGPNHLLRGQTSAVTDMVFGADARDLTVLHENQTVVCWDLVAGEKRGSWSLPKDERTVALLPTGRSAITSDENGQFRKHDFTGAEPVMRPLFKSSGGEISFIAADRTGMRLASIGKDRKVAIWDGTGGTKIAEWQFPGPVEAVAFTPDARRLVTLNGNGTGYVLAVPASGSERRGEAKAIGLRSR